MTTAPSANVAVNEKVVPDVKAGPKSEANVTKAPPSATAKLTDPFAALRSAVSRLAAAPRAQDGDAESASQAPPAVLRNSRRVTARAPLPAWTVTRKVPSRAPSELKAAEARNSVAHGMPRNTRLSTGGGRTTVKPPARIAVWPPVATVTSRGPSAAVGATAR